MTECRCIAVSILFLVTFSYYHNTPINISYGTLMFPDTNSTNPSLEGNNSSFNSTLNFTNMFVSGEEISDANNSKVESNNPLLG